MVGMGLTIYGALLVTISTGWCNAEEAHWPNLSCHPANSSDRQEGTFDFYRMSWHSCLEAYQEYKGNCAYICALTSDRILIRKAAGEPVTFDVDEFMKYFAKGLGYSMKGVGGAEQERMTEVRSKMESCKKSNPDYAGITNTRKSPCGPYKGFLECFDNAIGCGVFVIDQWN